MTVRPEIHTGPHLPAELVDGWRTLVADDPGGSWFMTPDWVLAWWETLGAGRPAEIAVWRGPDGRPDAVVPLLRGRQTLHPRLPLTVDCLTLLGSGPGAADHCGIPTRPERRADVRDWLAERARRTTLWLPDLDPGQDVLLPPTARPVVRAACPRADLTAGPDALGSRQFRATVRRYGRKLAAAGVTFRWVDAGEADERLLDTVLHLHRLRRDALGRPTTFDQGRRPLHARLLERTAGTGHGPAFLLAERDTATVGALYGFRWRDSFSYYQIGWEPELAPLRLGTAVIDQALRACAERGLRTFDFLRGTEPYKYRFGAVDREDVSWLVPRGTSGALLALKHRVRDAARSRPQPASTTPSR
ncbi:GNAT family N-acetyltransferase [Kitasatospora paracochleata]|uniref:CelD/BcsL family acetyltransferase involved in cellulose biosynthesis n=1 Tax=Kitasatospora paracochleata TaxID=58354 RepID=A0ABT1IT57_9ACTN|nr:GNAT family N-acetyltransferase [Kitasatospora paracochleata]MCP2308315.1 CelD/BcsL family acetyltransferase involved in cellulose biosynthesis [Kitasatospora paracochleata]